MYTLLKGWHKYLNRRDEYFILLVGLDNAGKTTLLEKIKSTYGQENTLQPDQIIPTVGLNIGRIELDSLGGQSPTQTASAPAGTLQYYWQRGKHIMSPLLDPNVGLGGGGDQSRSSGGGGKSRLSFWDVGGQSDLQSIWASYYAECHAIVFMIDSTDRERLERDVGDVFNKMISNQDCEGVPVLMLANKQDIKERAVSVEQVKQVFNRLAVRLDAVDSRVMPVSALTGEGIRDAMEWLQLRLLRNRSNRPPRLSD